MKFELKMQEFGHQTGYAIAVVDDNDYNSYIVRHAVRVLGKPSFNSAALALRMLADWLEANAGKYEPT